ncbi:MAG: hypothetical protein L0323_21330 [Planctomycetes bacterium]|nr:hypothetical protein [Planctomycetota bacterium]
MTALLLAFPSLPPDSCAPTEPRIQTDLASGGCCPREADSVSFERPRWSEKPGEPDDRDGVEASLPEALAVAIGMETLADALDSDLDLSEVGRTDGRRGFWGNPPDTLGTALDEGDLGEAPARVGMVDGGLAGRLCQILAEPGGRRG